LAIGSNNVFKYLAAALGAKYEVIHNQVSRCSSLLYFIAHLDYFSVDIVATINVHIYKMEKLCRLEVGLTRYASNLRRVVIHP
jgi:hypothetical protein